MPVGAAVAGQAGIHQAQAVQQLCPGAEGAADAGHARALVQRQRGGHIQHLVHSWPSRPAGSCGGGYRSTAPPDTAGSPLHAARPAPARICRSRTHRAMPTILPEWDVHVDILEVVNLALPERAFYLSSYGIPSDILFLPDQQHPLVVEPNCAVLFIGRKAGFTPPDRGLICEAHSLPFSRKYMLSSRRVPAAVRKKFFRASSIASRLQCPSSALTRKSASSRMRWSRPFTPV